MLNWHLFQVFFLFLPQGFPDEVEMAKNILQDKIRKERNAAREKEKEKEIEKEKEKGKEKEKEKGKVKEKHEERDEEKGKEEEKDIEKDEKNRMRNYEKFYNDEKENVKGDEKIERERNEGRDEEGERDKNEDEIEVKEIRKKNKNEIKTEELNEKELFSETNMRNSDPWILDAVVLVSVIPYSEEDLLEVEVEVEGRGIESWEWSLGTFKERYSLMRTMHRTFRSCVCRRKISLLEQFYPPRDYRDPYQDTPMVRTYIHTYVRTEVFECFFYDLVVTVVFDIKLMIY